MYPNLQQYATEAISHQKETVLRDAMVAHLTDLREQSKIVPKDLVQFSKIVAMRTGLNLTFTLGDDLEAYMVMPDIDPNNPIINTHQRWFQSGKDAVKLLGTKPKIKGTVDLAASKVTGDWTNLNTEIVIGRRLLEKGILTPIEVVAIMLHEIGHFFTYLEMLGTTVSTNYAIQAAMSDSAFGTDRKRTKELLFAIDGHLSISIDNKDEISKGNKDVITAAILSDTITKQQSEYGTSIFDERGCEVLADQFAARHGVGMALVTGLDKLGRMYGERSYWSTPTFVMVELVKVSFTLSLIAFPSPISVMALAGILLTNPAKQAYDEPYQRAKRIRDQVTSALKDRNLTKERRKDLLSQIEAIDATMKDVHDRTSFYNFLWRNVLPWGTKETDRVKLQRSLETMMNNDFYVSANRLKQLA